MDRFELFCKDHQYTIQLFVALGTFAAVIVTLFLARAKTLPKLHIFVDTKTLIPSGAQQTGTVDWSKCKAGVGVTIRNVGQTVVHISYYSFYWMLPFPFKRMHALTNPIPDFRKEGSLRLEPRTTIALMLSSDLEDFYNNVILYLCEINEVPICMRQFVRRFMILCVKTDCGATIKAKIGNDLKKLFINIYE